jgi:hypothetical protein
MVLGPVTPSDVRLILDRLEKHDQATARIEGKLDSLVKSVHDHEIKDQERHTEIVASATAASHRIASLEAQVGKIEDQSETTGQHQIDRLQAKLDIVQKDHQDSGRHWQAIAVAVLIALISALGGYFAR